MNKKLGRLLQPGLAWYFAVMLAFGIAALALQYMTLGIVAAFLWEAVLVVRPAGLSGGRKMC